jgi:hypothetical protein
LQEAKAEHFRWRKTECNRKKKAKMKTYILLISLATTQLLVSAQTISGIVRDESGEPLAGCNVYLEGTFYGASSQADGTFSFDASINDTASLVAAFLGYEEFRMPIDAAQKNEKIHVEITLEEAFNTLDAVTVTAGRYGAGEVSEVAVLTSLDVATTAGALADVSAAMQTLPGTARNGESGRLFVRGGTANETGTYIDGILVHQPYTTSAPNLAVRGRFNPFMFSGSAFSTGGYSAEYGQALSSVLAMNTNDMPNEENLNLSLMTVGADVAGTKMWDNGAITVSANYMNLKPYMSLVPQNYSWLQEPESYGAAVNFRQKTKNNGLVKVYATVDDANLMQQQFRPGSENASNLGVNNKNRFVNANFKELLGSKLILKGGASFTYNSDAFADATGELTENLRGVHGKLMASYELSERTHIKAGSEYFYKSFSQLFTLPELQLDSALQFSDHKFVGFTEINHYISKKLVVNAGMRFENSSYLNRANLAPRIALAYQLPNDQQLSLAYGRFYQDPSNQFLLNSAQLDYEDARHFILSYNKNWENRLIRAEAYYKQYNNLVKFSENSTVNNNGFGYAYGADLFYRDSKTVKNGDFWVSYSFMMTERNFLNYPELASPDFTNTHTLNIVYKHWFAALRSQLGATISFGSPRPHNNPNNPAFMDERLPAYKSLDLNWSFLFRENIIFHAAISNVLGFENVFGYTYAPIPDAGGAYQRSPIVPGANQFFFVGCFITLSKKGTTNQLDKIN